MCWALRGSKEVIVKRRLYFLLPDVAHTRSVVAELEAIGIENRCLHVITGKGVDVGSLPVASPNQRNDPGARLETILWDGNLLLFFMALLLLILFISLDMSLYWLLLPAAFMLVTLVTGVEFTRHIPNVHLSEFTDALHHQELLLMVDVPVRQVARIEELIHRHHPEALTSGTGWQVDALHI